MSVVRDGGTKGRWRDRGDVGKRWRYLEGMG